MRHIYVNSLSAALSLVASKAILIFAAFFSIIKRYHSLDGELLLKQFLHIFPPFHLTKIAIVGIFINRSRLL